VHCLLLLRIAVSGVLFLEAASSGSAPPPYFRSAAQGRHKGSSATSLMAGNPAGNGDKSPASLWLSERDPLDTHRTTAELPKRCDVVIVGAGMAGCSAALRCTELGLTCCVLDSRGVCGGATGTNGGHM